MSEVLLEKAATDVGIEEDEKVNDVRSSDELDVFNVVSPEKVQLPVKQEQVYQHTL